MRHVRLLCLVLASTIVASNAYAEIIFLADGTLNGVGPQMTADKSGLSHLLEDGLPANLLGGVGSGLAYAGGDTFLAIPDRGPNATRYNDAVDDTVSYVCRFHTVTMTLTPNSPGSTLPFRLTPTLVHTTLLWSQTPLAYGSGAGLGNRADGQPLGPGAPAENKATTFYFTGRSDNFDTNTDSADPSNARLDPESIRLSNDGKSVFISDEYGPYLYQFDRETGRRVRSFTLPSHLAVKHPSPAEKTEIEANHSGRVANKGMEGLAVTPDGNRLIGMMQAPLIQDKRNDDTKSLLRIVMVDIASGATREYGYKLTVGSGVSEILAINDHQFLVDERDGKGLGDGSKAKVKQLFVIDLRNAEDISNLSGAAAEAAVVTKIPFLDIVKELNNHGIPSAAIPAKIEGLAFGQDVLLGGVLKHTLYVANDNDFVADSAGGNRFFVFGFDDSDLPGYAQQRFVEEERPRQ